MTQSFFVPGKLPGANDCLWKHWRVFQRLKAKHQRVILYAMLQTRLKPMRAAAIHFEWREPNQKRDPDNIMFGQKFVLDALVQRQILKDDGWMEITGIAHSFTIDINNPGVWITLDGN